MTAVMNTYARYPYEFVSGSGSWLVEKNGEKFLDFTSGISVVNLGHCNRAVTEAISSQAGMLMHTSNLYTIGLQETLAARLSELSFADRWFFSNSGAEANEAALKLARIYGNKKFDGKRNKILTMKNSFHGRTFTTLSATGQDKIKAGFEPVLSNFVHADVNDFDAVAGAATDETVAIMVEPIQGEGGIIPVQNEFISKLRKLCDERDMLLIFDEIQTAFGRTGKMFGYEHSGVVPDVITLAKALGNGMPIGCMGAKEEFAEYLSPGTHGSTFGGNFLACAAGNAVLDEMTKPDFMEKVEDKGKKLKQALQGIFGDKGCEVRGLGLMLGVQFKDGGMKRFIDAAFKQKLLVIPAANETVRFFPALTIMDEELDFGIQLIRNAADVL